MTLVDRVIADCDCVLSARHASPTPRADFALAAGIATGGASRLAPELLLAIFRPIRRIALVLGTIDDEQPRYGPCANV
jgi:hypothetical protein